MAILRASDTYPDDSSGAPVYPGGTTFGNGQTTQISNTPVPIDVMNSQFSPPGDLRQVLTKPTTPGNWSWNGTAWVDLNAPAATTGGDTPAGYAGGGGGSGYGGGALGGLLGPIDLTPPNPGDFPAYQPTAGPQYNAPGYTPPAPFSYADFAAPAPFVAPTADQAFNEPGYQFRLAAGNQGLTNSAAGKGILRTGGTLKDFINYNQNAASQEYQNVYGRAENTYQNNFNDLLNAYTTGRTTAQNVYDTNYKTQFSDPFNFATTTAQNTLAPQLAEWQTNSAAQQRNAELAFQQAQQQYQDLYTQQYNNRLFQYNGLNDIANRSLTAALG